MVFPPERSLGILKLDVKLYFFKIVKLARKIAAKNKIFSKLKFLVTFKISDIYRKADSKKVAELFFINILKTENRKMKTGPKKAINCSGVAFVQLSGAETFKITNKNRPAETTGIKSVLINLFKNLTYLL